MKIRWSSAAIVALFTLATIAWQPECRAQATLTNINGQNLYVQSDTSGKPWSSADPVHLQHWIRTQNIALSSRTRAENEAVPTGVITANFPHPGKNWYAGAVQGQGETIQASPLGPEFSLTVFGPNAQANLASIENDSGFKTVSNQFGERLHAQAYTRDKAEEIAPGITGHDAAGSVIGILDHRSANDGKVVWRGKGETPVKDIVAQLRERADPGYDPDKDPGSNQFPGLTGPLADVAQSPTTKLAAAGIVILLVWRSTWTG